MAAKIKCQVVQVGDIYQIVAGQEIVGFSYEEYYARKWAQELNDEVEDEQS